MIVVLYLYLLILKSYEISCFDLIVIVFWFVFLFLFGLADYDQRIRGLVQWMPFQQLYRTCIGDHGGEEDSREYLWRDLKYIIDRSWAGTYVSTSHVILFFSVAH
jgi:hypothetical protein